MYSKITISGKICTGKSSVFRELDKKLKWPTFSSGAYFREYAKSHSLELNAAEEQTANLTRKVDGMVAEMLKKPGNLLLDAWLGGILADDTPGVLKVLLTADDSVRYNRFAEREHVSVAQAKGEVISRDSSWFDKIKKIHKRNDIFQTNNYDLIIDTSHLTINEVVDLVIKRLG